ncbi:Transposon TX1 uncharacterized 149 kDa protein [Vitis vinifera]|uniref:Transposon TX1 uncharacterized 149 kDa protein n=1 Tax=Vitis vinifera TaxID=29760 RepID=A0A438GSA4_VITVI|nr:Transposon TX1 uncharacterized 149 kDa protein [Vitis vinifera]
MREGIANTYQQLLSENPGWKADIGGLLLNQISPVEADGIEVPFSETEIYTALMGMNGDKALGPDGFTVAFWQNSWEIVKEDMLGLFKEFHDQPISLLGGLYKLLAKVLANRLKKVIGKVISPDQNAFIKGRQILDGSLITNEVIDAWQKRGEKGIVCKLDIEKAYDIINWQFLLKVMQKMGFGSKWIGWIWNCISTVKYSVLVNGVPAGFFSSTKGLRQGDPLSPTYLSWAWKGGGWVLDMAAEIGCRVGQLPTVYLGLPLGAPNRAVSVWDGVEERMRRRLALWKRQYLSKGGRITLIKSTLASISLYQMSVFRMPKSVARRIEKLQRDFLWGGANGGRGALEKVLEAKYGKEELGWRTRKANGAFGVGVWKEILKESTWCWENMGFKVGKGNRIRFWTDLWCGDNVLSQGFPNLFSMAAHRNVTVEECWDQNMGQGGWNLG